MKAKKVLKTGGFFVLFCFKKRWSSHIMTTFLKLQLQEKYQILWRLAKLLYQPIHQFFLHKQRQMSYISLGFDDKSCTRWFINSLLGLVYFIFTVNHALTILEGGGTFFFLILRLWERWLKNFFFFSFYGYFSPREKENYWFRYWGFN